ncbi:MAG: hypothetical protein ABSD38_24265 [Syntrophorhabdales bacterium]|jgi:hypothetical protein
MAHRDLLLAEWMAPVLANNAGKARNARDEVELSDVRRVLDKGRPTICCG